MPELPEQCLADAIAREEARLAELERQVELTRHRLTVLREQRPPSPPVAPTAPNGLLAPAEKVSLFRSLFRGRADVFPKLWVNSKTAKKGYAHGEAPLGYGDPREERLIELDADVPPDFED
jgi:hypothetical protein